MSNTLGDYSPYPARTLGRDRVTTVVVVPIGGSGAIGTLDGDQGWGVTRSTTGVYSVTFPPVASNARAVLKTGVLVSASLTVVGVEPTVFSGTAGTATVKAFDASGAAANPASGDSLWFELTATIGGAGA